MFDYQRIESIDPENGNDDRKVSFGRNKFTVSVAICFTINYVMGTGFLTMPWAFAQTGILPGILFLILMGCCAVISKDYILETMARAENKSQGGLESPALQRLRKQRMDEQKISRLNDDTSLIKRERASSDLDLLENENHSSARLLQGNINHSVYTPNIAHSNRSEKDNYSSVIGIEERKIEIPSLCQLYLGDTGRFLYCFFLALYIYGTLWVYTSVFAQAFQAVIPILKDHNDYNYYIYVGIFAVIVVPLTCMELTEQIAVQVIMSGFRFLMVFLMVATTLPAYWDNNPNEPIFGSQTHSANFSETFNSPEGWQKLYLLIPIVTYAYIYHHSLPGLSHPIEEKRKLGFIFNVTFLLCGILYATLAVTVSAYFGIENMDSSSNLNWTEYHGIKWAPWLQFLVSKFILLFPAFDVVSAAPLNGITLGNNLLVAFYKNEEACTEKSKILAFRLLASIPPIIGALMVKNLGHITDYTGIAGMIITFVFPSLLQWYSRAALKQDLETNSGKTIYATFLTKKRFIPLVGIFGLVLSIYSFVYNIKETVTSH